MACMGFLPLKILTMVGVRKSLMRYIFRADGKQKVSTEVINEAYHTKAIITERNQIASLTCVGGFADGIGELLTAHRYQLEKK